MNLKKRKQISKLKSSLINSVFEEATEGVISNIDSSIFVNINGMFKILQISFEGEPFITNTLPDGYSITMNATKIIIINLINKPLKKTAHLFNYSGNLKISSASIHNLKGKRIVLKTFDGAIKGLMNESVTALEDDTIIIQEDVNRGILQSSKRGIDSFIVKGLYKNKKFENGYSGYYNYDFINNTYITGKTITRDSKIINRTNKDNTNPNKLRILKTLIAKVNERSTKTSYRGSIAKKSAISKKIGKSAIRQDVKITKKGKY